MSATFLEEPLALKGERTIERLLSVSVTGHVQKRSLFANMSSVLIARIRGDLVHALA
jgi:hypothetical protein